MKRPQILLFLSAVGVFVLATMFMYCLSSCGHNHAAFICGIAGSIYPLVCLGVSNYLD